MPPGSVPMPRGWELADDPDSIGTVRKQAAV